MTGEQYKKFLINKMIVDSPKYLKQRLVNDIVSEKIGTYGNEKEGIISLTGMTIDEKILACMNSNCKTTQLVDLLEFQKAYKYIILFRYSAVNIDRLREIATDVKTNYYENYNSNEINDQVLFFEDELHIYVKFHKFIDIINQTDLTKKFVRYPIIFVFHKDCDLFEVRFDKLSHNRDYNFYKITMEARLAWLGSNLGLKWGYFDSEKSIKYIVENKKEYVKEIIWAFETAMSKGLTLKAGEDGIMPFIGDLERLISSLLERYQDETAATECLREVNDYLDKTKRFANEKYKLLSWIKKEENGETSILENPIYMKVIFKYEKRRADLINIYDNDINDMERIGYVIGFIKQVAKSLGELQNQINGSTE